METSNLKLKKPDFGCKLPTGTSDEGDNLDTIDQEIQTLKDALLIAAPVTDMPNDGAIAVKNGIVKLSHVADAGAYTMNESGVGDAGSKVILVATTAKAHVVECSKFNNDETKPKLTFGGAIGDFVVLASLGALGWFIIGSGNVTQGA